MKTRDLILTGILLLLTGILIGTLISLYQYNPGKQRPEVRVTEIKQNTEPVWSDSVLKRLNDRFLMQEVVDRVRPSVVYIKALIGGAGRAGVEGSRGSDENDIWDRLFPNRRHQTVGSGVIISSNGYILTNNHVIKGAVKDGIEVTLHDKRRFTASIVGRDPTTDLAVLKIPAENLPAATIGDSDDLDVGEWVLAIGNPFRLKSTVTAGIISALHRNVQIIDMDQQLRVESYIQTDAAINKGNSGGALVNIQGRLIGINTAIASASGGYQGYGFAVPIDLAIKVAEDLIEFGEVHRAFLGISMQSIDYQRSRELGLDQVRGVEILEVMDESAAAKAGLQPHDAILAIGQESIEAPNELQQEIAEHRPGDRVLLTVWRDGKKLRKTVRLGSVEETAAFLAQEGESNQRDRENQEFHRRFQSYKLGITVMSLAMPEDPGREELVITRVFKGSEAWRAGLRKGGTIKRVNGERVEELQTLEHRIKESLAKNGKVSLYVETGNHSAQTYSLEIDEH